MGVWPVMVPCEADGCRCLPLRERVLQAVYLGSIDKGFVSKLRMAVPEKLDQLEDSDQIYRGNSCSSVLVKSFYLTLVSEEQEKIGMSVKQTAPILAHTLLIVFFVMQSTWARTQCAELLYKRVAITRNIALYSWGLFSP